MEAACGAGIFNPSGEPPRVLGPPHRSDVAPHDPLIVHSAAIRKVADLVRNVAGTDTPVLVQGEFGVGKTVVAHEIHRRSQRAAGPFVHVACGALRESDLNDRLFGAPGGPSSAGKPGLRNLLESSHGGTLFLDDVCQLPMWVQVGLLDFFQQTDNQSRHQLAAVPASGRVIAATTRDLEIAMDRNDFYSGLYYYLSVVHIRIPPLRHRQEDIRVLGEHFLAAANSMRCESPDGAPRRFTE
jgi:two-component system response regulator AtoC